MSGPPSEDPAAAWRRQLASWLKRAELNAPVPTAEDVDFLLPFVVDDALQGIDVIERYPGFFQALLDDDALADFFITSLALLEGTNDGVPPASRGDTLRFVQPQFARPQIRVDAEGRWRLRWQLAVPQLTQRLFPASGTAAVPQPGGALETPGFTTLLRESVTLEAGDVNVELQLEQTPGDRAQAQLNLMAEIKPGLTPRQRIAAAVRWNDYEAAGLVTDLGLLSFPLVTLAAVLDTDARAVRAPLVLSLSLLLKDG